MSGGGSILVLNAGSSSLKFALFDNVDDPKAAVRGEIEALRAAPRLRAWSTGGAILLDKGLDGDGHPFVVALNALLDFTDAHLGPDGLAAVGHRVVHGGAEHLAPEAVTPTLLAALQGLTPLDPLHMPDNLAPISAIAASRPDLRQAVCFDTAFHHTMPPVAARFGLPREISDTGVRRYGFHGLSFEYIAGRLAGDAPDLARGRVIVAHLGSGASLCAMRSGASIAVSTGFSALDGLVMATRCGSLDPGVILYLGRAGHCFDDIEDMLYRRSGLLGVSGLSDDIRVLLASDEPHAREAVELFVYRIAIEAGGMAAALGGVDGLVFTAGIGEHSATIRAMVCERLAWLGLDLDAGANAAGAERISTPHSKIDARVIATDEEVVIARHTRAVIRAADA
jgi:acetate kinase